MNSTQAERETGGEARVETRERLVREENRRPPERHSVTPFYSWLLPERLQYYYNRVLIPFILYTKALFHFLPIYISIHQLFTPLRRSLVIARISRSQCFFFYNRIPHSLHFFLQVSPLPFSPIYRSIHQRNRLQN